MDIAQPYYGGLFEAIQKAATSNGGGVVYFTAGTCVFKTNVVIVSVICGEPISGMAKKGTTPGSLSPKTIFKCTFGEHIEVFNNDSKGANFGLLLLNGCAVKFWPALKSTSEGQQRMRWV